MEIKKLRIPGCYFLLIQPKVDERGEFHKYFSRNEYLASGLCTDFIEEYYSRSYRGVIRGLHFQAPPYEHFKIVSCIHGQIKDVIVDLRVGSPTYNSTDVYEIYSQDGWQLYLPPGIAHGFLVESREAIVMYRVTSQYSSSHDSGILWNSVPIDWGVKKPILSPRDRSFPRLVDFVSPFVFLPG